MSLFEGAFKTTRHCVYFILIPLLVAVLASVLVSGAVKAGSNISTEFNHKHHTKLCDVYIYKHSSFG